jgi:hypothetical protein
MLECGSQRNPNTSSPNRVSANEYFDDNEEYVPWIGWWSQYCCISDSKRDEKSVTAWISKDPLQRAPSKSKTERVVNYAYVMKPKSFWNEFELLSCKFGLVGGWKLLVDFLSIIQARLTGLVKDEDSNNWTRSNVEAFEPDRNAIPTLWINTWIPYGTRRNSAKRVTEECLLG